MACIYMVTQLVAFVVTLASTSLASTCPMVQKTNAQVERRLLNEGFHRDLETTVFISSPENLQSCIVLIKDIFPSGSYVDPNQLRFNKAFGGPDFHVPQVINVETPEHQSPRVFAYFFKRALRMEDGRWLVNMTIPVHFRYHRARSGATYPLEVPVRLQHPAVFLQCEEAGGEICRPLLQLEPCPPSGPELCEWLPVHTFSTTEAVMGLIPVGNTDSLDTVLLATTSITAGATLLILAALTKNRIPRS
ncbi:phosphatidylinositol-glycan biosynthesis class X protein [Penaeus vannamei]|uniref:phosphatidylinositol-glycan biosynthesis class X protein n=1 Tax=Penaeus vannamei TaxID=6689 RepID=UPI00387F749D